jgi:hypothetical protein
MVPATYRAWQNLFWSPAKEIPNNNLQYIIFLDVWKYLQIDDTQIPIQRDALQIQAKIQLTIIIK